MCGISNYYSNRLDFGPKIIYGWLLYHFYSGMYGMPWLNIDWSPASEPYDIPIPE